MKLYQVAHFHAFFLKKTSHFSKIEIFGTPAKNPQFSDFCGTLVKFDTKISQSGKDTSIPNNNNLLELVISFQTICEEIL